MFKKLEIALALFFFKDIFLEIEDSYYKKGKVEGYTQGKKEGYESGYNIGNESGYIKGFNDGSNGGMYMNQHGLFVSNKKLVSIE
jgi:flagellar biosynthesis/type III secretory pathway protein FliH